MNNPLSAVEAAAARENGAGGRLRANGGMIAIIAGFATVIMTIVAAAALILESLQQLNARVTSLETAQQETNANLRDINGAIRDLNTRVGRIEGHLGIGMPPRADDAERNEADR